MSLLYILSFKIQSFEKLLNLLLCLFLWWEVFEGTKETILHIFRVYALKEEEGAVEERP